MPANGASPRKFVAAVRRADMRLVRNARLRGGTNKPSGPLFGP